MEGKYINKKSKKIYRENKDGKEKWWKNQTKRK